MNKYRLTFFSCKNMSDEIVSFETLQDFNNLKIALLEKNYIKDLKAFKFDKKLHDYKEIAL